MQPEARVYEKVCAGASEQLIDREKESQIRSQSEGASGEKGGCGTKNCISWDRSRLRTVEIEIEVARRWAERGGGGGGGGARAHLCPRRTCIPT